MCPQTIIFLAALFLTVHAGLVENSQLKSRAIKSSQNNGLNNTSTHSFDVNVTQSRHLLSPGSSASLSWTKNEKQNGDFLTFILPKTLIELKCPIILYFLL